MISSAPAKSYFLKILVALHNLRFKESNPVTIKGLYKNIPVHPLSMLLKNMTMSNIIAPQSPREREVSSLTRNVPRLNDVYSSEGGSKISVSCDEKRLAASNDVKFWIKHKFNLTVLRNQDASHC